VRTGEDALGSGVMWGEVTYMEKASLPAALSVRFNNDTVERLTADQVSPILCEEGIEMPSIQVAFPTLEPSLSCALNVSFENGKVERITTSQVSAISMRRRNRNAQSHVAFPAVATTLQMLLLTS
jgi:hypothetical protein